MSNGRESLTKFTDPAFNGERVAPWRLSADHHLRIARPVSNLSRTQAMYCEGLGLRVLGVFENHAGFDGLMLGSAGMGYHLEFTTCRAEPMTPRPTPEDLLVFYLPDHQEWQRRSADMLAAGFREVTPFNPYWAGRGRTFTDPDGYRVVLQNAAWDNVEVG